MSLDIAIMNRYAGYGYNYPNNGNYSNYYGQYNGQHGWGSNYSYYRY